MKAVFQRVSQASVHVGEKLVGKIGPGAVVLLGVASSDSNAEADWLAKKILQLRVFRDAAGQMNLSLLETGGQMLIVSQFTLFGDCRKGRRPSYIKAARPEQAEPIYQYFVEKCRQSGVHVETGKFGARMNLCLNNDGPVTLILQRQSDDS